MGPNDRAEIAQFLTMVGQPDLFRYYELPPEATTEERDAAVKRRRSWAQGQQSNPKYRAEALFVIKHNTQLRALFVDGGDAYRGTLATAAPTVAPPALLPPPPGLADPDRPAAPKVEPPAQDEDLYALLGIAPDAHPDDVAAAWQTRWRDIRRALAPEAQGPALARLDRAWQTLGDPESRRRYDAGRAGPEALLRPAGGPAATADAREPTPREPASHEPTPREPASREPEPREPDAREPDAREPDTREPDAREPEPREPEPRVRFREAGPTRDLGARRPTLEFRASIVPASPPVGARPSATQRPGPAAPRRALGAPLWTVLLAVVLLGVVAFGVWSRQASGESPPAGVVIPERRVPLTPAEIATNTSWSPPPGIAPLDLGIAAERAITDRTGDIARCFEGADPDDTVTLAAYVGPDGGLRGLGVTTENDVDAGELSCLRDLFLSMRFPAFSGEYALVQTEIPLSRAGR